MPDTVGSAIGGQQFRVYQRGSTTAAGGDQYVVPVFDRVTSFAGRAASFRIPGNAAVSQTLVTLHNATGSTVLINVNRVLVDVTSTAVKATALVQPPVIRIYRITALPTGGAAMNKVGFDSTQTSSASVTCLQGASADRTGVAITATVPTTTRMAQVPAPRLATFAGFEVLDPIVFFEGPSDVTLRALEGIAVVLEDAVVTTGNPATDWWTVMVDFEEFTRP